jgi:hypothetical protein
MMTAARIHSSIKRHRIAPANSTCHAGKRRRPPGGEVAALLVEADGDQRPDHHEAGQRREQDIVEAEREQRSHHRDRQHEDREAVGEAGQGRREEIAPAGGEPAEGGRGRQAAPAAVVERDRGLA